MLYALEKFEGATLNICKIKKRRQNAVRRSVNKRRILSWYFTVEPSKKLEMYPV
jgi:hypothetical protein